MQIEAEMRYALRLTKVIQHCEFEDLFKLASVVDSIAKLRRQCSSTDVELDTQFRAAMRVAHATSGPFRQEVARFADAKRLLASL